MPCAAPCTRFPCNERCPLKLSCGHQCPGICGEVCPKLYCQLCSDRKDERVDLLEMKTYAQIDLNETPIVVLGCGHFLTAESLDGHIGMAEVYNQGVNGEYTAIKDISASLARSIPRCPDCQQPVRQYSTQRYNRVINRAVIDEMSKRFITKGKADLRELEQQILDLELEFSQSRQTLTDSIRQTMAVAADASTHDDIQKIFRQLRVRYHESQKLGKAIQRFRESVADKHQPAQKLQDAIISTARQKSLDHLMGDLAITVSAPQVARDCRISFGGRIAQLQAEHVTLTDKFEVAQALKSVTWGASNNMPRGFPEQSSEAYFTKCLSFAKECDEENLPKLAVEATLYYARTARSNEVYCQSLKTSNGKASEYVANAKELLTRAKKLCTLPFQNAQNLRTAVNETLKLLRKSWYEEVTPEEIAAIKQAMVSGPRGLNTHSGHWYNCANGHPVSEPRPAKYLIIF